MSAPNTVSASTMDQKPREPSMEEILASIRRIIADDQGLPGRVAASVASPSVPPEAPASEASMPTAAADVSAPEDREMRNVDFAVEPDRQDAEEAIVGSDALSKVPTTRDPTLEPIRQHGTIAAPQFADPGWPAHQEAFHADPGDAEGISHAEASLRQVEHDATAEAWQADAEQMSAATLMEGEDVAYQQDRDDHTYAARPDIEADSEPEEAPLLFSAATDTSVQSAFNMLAATRLADNSDELKAMVREMIRPLLRGWLDDNLPTMVERMVRAEIERVARGGR